MIPTWVLDRIHCRWTLQWLTAGARAKLPHVSALSLAFACGGSGPPPPARVPPPPPVASQPPPAAWTPPPSPFKWEYVPDETPAGTPYPIPLGPLVPQPPFAPVEGFGGPPIEVAVPPLCPPETPAAPVPEPAGIALVGFGLATLGAFQLIRRSRPVVPGVRWRVIVSGE